MGMSVWESFGYQERGEFWGRQNNKTSGAGVCLSSAGNREMASVAQTEGACGRNVWRQGRSNSSKQTTWGPGGQDSKNKNQSEGCAENKVGVVYKVGVATREVDFLCPVPCHHVSCAERPRQRLWTEVLNCKPKVTFPPFISICMSSCVHTFTCTNTQVYVWKPKVNVGSLPQLISTLPFGDSLSLNLGLLIWVAVTGIFLDFLPPGAGVIAVPCWAWLSWNGCLESSFRTPCFHDRQALYGLNYLPSSKPSFFEVFWSPQQKAH